MEQAFLSKLHKQRQYSQRLIRDQSNRYYFQTPQVLNHSTLTPQQYHPTASTQSQISTRDNSLLSSPSQYKFQNGLQLPKIQQNNQRNPFYSPPQRNQISNDQSMLMQQLYAKQNYPSNGYNRQIPETLYNLRRKPVLRDHMMVESKISSKPVSEQNSSKQPYDLEKGLSLEVKPLYNHLQLSNNDQYIIPMMVSVKTLDTQFKNIQILQNAKDFEQSRPSLDLVCVIDTSSSMAGEEIAILKRTLLLLVDKLSSRDRISLVQFASEGTMLCNLRILDDQNRSEIKAIIKSIEAVGATDIFSGVEIAFNLLQTRKQSNQVTSIFLLSDGQDDESEDKISKYLSSRQMQECSFTIHSFGFGDHHDGVLMNKIASLRDGNFYYVRDISQVDEFFIDALGGLFSVIAQKVSITVTLNYNNKLVQKYLLGSQIAKKYGNMWKRIKGGIQYQIDISQLFLGVSKDFVFEVYIPKQNEIKSIRDEERNIPLITASITAIPNDIVHSTKIAKETCMMLTLFTKDEQIPRNSSMNCIVEFNYLRVKAAEAMERAIAYSEEGKFELGQQSINKVMNQIRSAHTSNKHKLSVIKEDLKACSLHSMPQTYSQQGMYEMLSKKEANYYQKSQATGQNDLYSNSIQKLMVTELQSMKTMKDR